MHDKEKCHRLIFGTSSRAAAAVLAIAIVLALTVVLAQPVRAQYQVIYTFSGADGGSPYAGLTIDNAGNLYGTTVNGGATGYGTVFKLSRKASGWILTTLYTFQGGNDGTNPAARVIVGPDGNLYGTTYGGGGGGCGGLGCGTVFKLSVPPAALSPWTETVLYRFSGGSDGATPGLGDLVFDQAGNIYGTTIYGGPPDSPLGVVFKLSPSTGGWVEKVLYDFPNTEGSRPVSGVIFDQAGNLYGTTSGGGEYGLGTEFELTPSGGNWVETVLYSFNGGGFGGYGGNPIGGLTFVNFGGQSFVLFGTSSGGVNGEYYGTAFGLGFEDSFSGSGSGWLGGPGPWASLASKPGSFDVYGTTFGSGSNGAGSVFAEIWVCGCACYYEYHELHDFDQSDGYPISSLVFDTSNNAYGTTSAGVVFEIARVQTPTGSCAQGH